MGTSKPYGGPGDKIPLLPDWALPPPDGGDPVPEEEEEGESLPEPVDQAEEDEAGVEQEEDDEPNSVPSGDEPVAGHADLAGPPDTQSPGGSWKWAKAFLGRAASSGGGRAAFAKAARSYVRAHGGPRRAAQAATSGRSATARLGRFLADVSRRGLDAALDALDLATVVGRDAQTVFAAIANALAPNGASPEQAVAREAVGDVLEGLYERFALADGDLARLNSLSIDDVRQAVVDSVSSYIYHRWLQELGRQIEQKAISPAQAVRLERDVKQFVKDSTILDLKGEDVLAMDWDGEWGRAFVERIYADAYRLLGGAR